MARWISKEGEWKPAIEKVVLRNNSNRVMRNPSTQGKYVDDEIQPGEEFIYEGPDREALRALYNDGVEVFGTNFRKSPEFLQMLRELNFKNEKEYFKFVGYDREKEIAKFEEKIAKIEPHEITKKAEAIQVLGGGRDFSGSGDDRYGGFGKPKEIKE